MYSRTRIYNIILLSILCVSLVAGSLYASMPIAEANSEVDALKDQIAERNDRLKDIEAEIKQFQSELQKVGAEKSTLQKAINQLELERKKVQADISYTQNKIGATDLEINKLTLEISDTEDGIELNRQAIKETLRTMHEMDDESLFEALLKHESLSEFWGEIDTLDQVRTVIADKVTSLVSQRQLLTGMRDTNTKKRTDLVELQEQYSDQNKVLVANTTEKAQLLSATQSEEAAYQKLLREKEAARDQLLKELRDFESKLQFILDPNSIPAKGSAVFNWPVENVIITQYFGGTEFAKQNASIYAGRPYHPGIDLGVPTGTKIYAPLAGTVRATGNTDAFPGCYSWGKWTLIDHANGLSTLYAHQSVISVTSGQQVKTGEVIGYSGNTGYSTGPHLHFTVYAKAGVTVRKFNEIKAITSCGAATTPVAATDAYIDPMNYLPAR